MAFRHPRLIKQLLDVCRSTNDYRTAYELSVHCDDDLSVKRVARLIMNLEVYGYVFEKREQRQPNGVCVVEYRLLDASSVEAD